jgi:hypothetical protein
VLQQMDTETAIEYAEMIMGDEAATKPDAPAAD